ncbi:MAG: DUF4367 domain-containing protein [Oscillospiraceae bacterium]|nr:DUF4367 domain-containing protein [Oscillospiraceae bacterium]
MSDFDEATSRFELSLEKLSSQDLEEMLRYSTFSDKELDVKQIQKILSELEQREPRVAISTPEEAWEMFKSEYSGRESVYRDCAFDENGQAHDQADKYSQLKEVSTVHTHRRRPIVRIAVAVAIVAALLMGITATASAMGYDLWGAVATWTKETFGFSIGTSAPENSTESSFTQVHPEMTELQAALDEYGVQLSLLPSYLPEGFEKDEIVVDCSQENALFFESLVNGDETIIYRITRVIVSGGLFEKDESDPTVYEVGGIEHYIFTNMGQYCAAWLNGNFECGIFGLNSEEELHAIINSIYN